MARKVTIDTAEVGQAFGAVAAEHGIRFEGTGSDRSSRESVPVAVARAYVAAAEAAGRECSWAPDNDDPTQAWIYETEPARGLELAREVAARWPSLDDGSGDLRVIADQAVADDPATTAEDVAAIVRQAREDAALEAEVTS